MTVVSIFNLGIGGIARDIPPHLLPPEVWSNGKNVRFRDNKVVSFTGHKTVFDPPTLAPHWALGVRTAAEYFIMYAGLTDINVVDTSGTHTEITRISGDYTGILSDRWNGGILGGIPVITNNKDLPQSWSPQTAATKLIDLPNWPAGFKCKIMRAFAPFLVAMNVNDGTNQLIHMVKWSHPADPGSIPVSWDETDATRDTGEVELSDAGAGGIQDALQLRNSMLIYKETSTWAMTFRGGQSIFRFDPIFTQTGILTQRCVAPLPNREQHFLATGDDLVIHDGQQITSLLDKRLKRFLSNTIDPNEFERSFCVGVPLADEMWFCLPEIGATYPTLAMVWNYRDNTITFRELRDLSYIANAIIDESAPDPTWDTDDEAWDLDSTVWGQRTFNPQAIGILGTDPTNTKLFQLDETNQFDGVNIDRFIEREGLAIVGQDRQGQPKVDLTRRKLLKRIWPKADGDPFTVRVGAQEDIGGVIKWAPSQTFTPGVDRYLDFCVSGRLLAVRFESNTNVAYELHGYDLDIALLGEN